MEYATNASSESFKGGQQGFNFEHDQNKVNLERKGYKKSFLIFKHNKYLTIPTEKIAFFYIKYDCTIIVCYDKQEYPVNYSLEQVQQLLHEQHFFRINRQYLVSFQAIKEVEHYFARKLLVQLLVPTQEKLLVSKEKARTFLDWLENR